MSGLNELKVSATLDRLHHAARRDLWKILPPAIPDMLGALLRGRPIISAIEPRHLRDAYIAVSRAQGQFLYQTARAIGAKRIVEFGTSFGISAIYLSAALRDNGGGQFTGSEMEPAKLEAARENLAAAGLGASAEIRAGDAMKTLADVAGPLDMVLLDGWKDAYLPMLKLLTPKLRCGAVVMADNIFTFKKALAPYVAFVQNPSNGFHSMTLRLGDGFEFSVRTAIS